MAFVRVEAWEAPYGLSAAQAQAPLLDHRFSLQFRRGTAVAVSLAVHALLIWVFVARLTAGLALPEEEAEPPGVVTLFEVPGAAPEPPAMAASATASVVASRQPEIDTTVANEVPPPEWTISRIEISAPAAPAASRQPVSAATAAGGAGAPGAGSGAFDPYAGAAPVRLQAEQPPAGGAGVHGSLQLDRGLLEEIRKSVSRSLRSGHGTVQLAVRISNEGVVADAAAKAGTASPDAKARFRQALLGRRLFNPAGAQIGSRIVNLPLVELSRG